MANTADLYLNDVKSLINTTISALEESQVDLTTGYSTFISTLISIIGLTGKTNPATNIIGMAFSVIGMNYDSAEDQMSAFIEDLYDIRFAIQNGSYTAVRMDFSTTTYRGYAFVKDWEVVKVKLSSGKWVNN